MKDERILISTKQWTMDILLSLEIAQCICSINVNIVVRTPIIPLLTLMI